LARALQLSSFAGINAVVGNKLFLAAVTRTNSKPFKSSRVEASLPSLAFNAFVEDATEDEAEGVFDAGAGTGGWVFGDGILCL
jgi:hypothetical protein